MYDLINKSASGNQMRHVARPSAAAKCSCGGGDNDNDISNDDRKEVADLRKMPSKKLH